MLKDYRTLIGEGAITIASLEYGLFVILNGKTLIRSWKSANGQRTMMDISFCLSLFSLNMKNKMKDYMAIKNSK